MGMVLRRGFGVHFLARQEGRQLDASRKLRRASATCRCRPASIGIMCASPEGGGFECPFDEIRLVQ